MPAPASPQNDPYRYGWRYVRREMPDGSETFDQIPLTLEDVLYPEVGDFHAHSKAHEEACHYLSDVFRSQLIDDPTAVVLSDVRVAWDVPELRPNGPDIAVFRGVREQRNWSTFDCAKEGVRPDVIVEITSPETRSNDLIDKVAIYAQAGVPLYLIVDTRVWRGQETLYLLGYHLTPRGYEALAPDERGWFWIESVGVWLGLKDTRVVCFDRDGSIIGDYPEIMRSHAELESRVVAETTARMEAELRAKSEAVARVEAEERTRREAAARAEAEERTRQEAVARVEAEERARREAVARAEAEEHTRQEAVARTAAETRAAEAETRAAEAETRTIAFEARLQELEEAMQRLRGAS
jgi:Uma2 family endonuclease